MDRQVELNASEINQYFTCSLCNGYYKDAQVITECLHTFCRSCLLNHLENIKPACPQCGLDLKEKAKRDNLIRPDRQVQELLDKIFPELEAEDRRKEEALYKARGIPLKEDATPYPPSAPSNRSEPVAFVVPVASEVAVTLVAADPAEFPGLTETKHFLRTSGNLQINHIKKYICKLVGGATSDEIAVFCNGSEPLGKALNLDFILRTRWTDSSRDMVLTYSKVKV